MDQEDNSLFQEEPETGSGGETDLERNWDRQSSLKDNRLGHLWLISYSDFMTILMIFFLAMYGYTYLTKMALLKNRSQPMSYSEFSQKMVDLKKDLGEEMEVREDVEKIVLNLPENVLFASGQAELREKARRTLAELAGSVMLIPGQIIVEGHTDDVPVVKGRYRSNWELSAARAFSVIDELTRQGVPASRLAAWGFGENRPVAPNDVETNRIKNRRIAIILLKEQDKVKGENAHVG